MPPNRTESDSSDKKKQAISLPELPRLKMKPIEVAFL